jgi:putative membrane-bound dehydrogenase-like protein
MSRCFVSSFLAVVLAATSFTATAAEPLRVFIRGGEKNRGEKVHAHPRFLAEWQNFLAERGMKVAGANTWPTAEQMKETDVIVAYAQEGGDATPEQETALEEFVKRGGGLVVIHTASVSFTNPPWWKKMIGGAWVPNKTKWKEGPMDLYFVENQYIGGGHPITRGAANFNFDDEIYYDMDIAPEARVLATSYTPNVPAGKRSADGKVHIYDIQPQMWTYEKTAEGGTAPYRAFVTLPGHQYATFERPNYRALLLRGIAWAGKRENIDEFCKPEEISSLTYPEGGPQRPETTLKSLEVHPDFNLKLVAAEPLITKPMNFDWDPSGRLWVAETPEYPNGRRGMRPDYRGKEWKDHGGIDPTPGLQDRPAQDKITILSDSNGDGVMDKKEVFYEGLDLVTGLVFHKDGVIVTQAPDILWLRDTNKDGKADKVEKLYTGLGTNDTHAVINNPRWGWDGWIYATHGYSASDKVTNGDGSKKFGNIGSGVIRFKPDGSAIEQYSSKGGNTWGLTITNDNRVMWTQPTSGQLLMHTVLPEYALARGKTGKTNSFNVVIPSGKTFPAMGWEQLAYVQIDWVGSFTAAAGAVCYDGGAWPSEYNGDYLTTEPTINIIHHSRLTKKGASFTGNRVSGREETEFIRSRDMWWRPIEVRVGPDGQVYVADFYNQAVIHNDTRGPDHNRVNAAVRPDRDHYFGRIWKIEHKQSKQLAKVDLAKAGTDELLAQLSNPNTNVRMNASRLIAEKYEALPEPERKNMQVSTAQRLRTGWNNLSADAKMAALWTQQRIGAVDISLVQTAMTDKDPAVRRNAALVVEEVGTGQAKGALIAALDDPEPQVRLAALRALAASNLSTEAARGIVKAWPKLDDDYQRSAAIGAAMRNPADAIAAALDSGDSSLSALVSQLAEAIGEKNDKEAAAKLVIALGGRPANADALKRSILDTLASSLKAAPEMTPALTEALSQLLGSGARESVLPLAAKWDKGGALKQQVAKLTTDLRAKLADSAAPEADRLAAARSLIGLRSVNSDALAAVAAALAGPSSASLQKGLVNALGEANDSSAGIAIASAYAKLSPDAQVAAFDVVLKRADSANAFLDALKGGQVPVSSLTPASAFRLRTHPDLAVSKRAGTLLDELNPTSKAKNEVIAKIAAVVEQPGNVANGKQLFTTACAVCHKYDNMGVDVGPGLTGMGTHGPMELLTAIVDPNREVDPSFATWNIETKEGQFYTGIVASENAATVTLRSLAGQQEVKVADIKSRVNTGRSLMPEGFDGLGAEAVRDIIAYMQSVDGGNFRALDLTKAFTANTKRGLFIKESNAGDSLKFVKTGHVTVEGVPFNIVSPDKAPANVVLLKGGPRDSFSWTMPEKVEVPVGGFKANRLHFLGGVAGWGHPYGDEGAVVMRVTVHFSDGQRETLQLRNSVEFADYIREVDVPGSKLTKGLVKENQLRWFTKVLTRAGEIDRLTLDSPATGVATTTVAITAELADPNSPIPATAQVSEPAKKPTAAPAAPRPENAAFEAPVPKPPGTANGPRVLLVGGGSAHDFPKFFGDADKAILAPHVGWVDFTMNANGVAEVLENVDLLVWSANQPISAETRKALMDWVNAGKPLVLLHPGLWYNWNNFPEWNREVAAGGARGHDRYGEFSVDVTVREHPITAGLPSNFRISDELYWFEPDASGTPIEVLATANSPQKSKTYPQVFVVKHPKARIAGITLGHDAKSHGTPEFQALLRNAVKWAVGK